MPRLPMVLGCHPDGGCGPTWRRPRPLRLWAFDVVAPGVVRKQPFPSPHGGRLIVGLGGYQRFDSLAVDASGNICVATLITGAVTSMPTGWARSCGEVKMPRSGDHQHLFRWCGFADCVRYAFREPVSWSRWSGRRQGCRSTTTADAGCGEAGLHRYDCGGTIWCGAGVLGWCRWRNLWPVFGGSSEPM